MLWALSVIAMWKRKNETGALKPFDLSRSNKLINDALAVVGKIAKLGLPYDESVGGG